jgi:hypothetical protein
MDITRHREVVSHISYRDWHIQVHDDIEAPSAAYLRVLFNAPDSITGDHALQRGRKWRLSESMTTSEIVTTALAAVLAAVEHEAREDFRYCGEAIFSPHVDVKALVELSRGS